MAGLTDHSATLEQIQDLDLTQRAAVLSGIRQELADALRQAQDFAAPAGQHAAQGRE